jgi:hypothetical protein
MRSHQRESEVMDKSSFESDYYVYQLSSEDLGVYYIGSHYCTGRSYSCTDKTCNYKGSSQEVRKLKEQHPEFIWKMEILAFADSRQELADLETQMLEWYIGDPHCLNKIVASPSRAPVHTDLGLEAIRNSARATHIKMRDSSGKCVRVLRDELFDKLRLGYRIKGPIVWMKNNELELYGQFSSKTVGQVAHYLERHRWEYGYDRSFTLIGAKTLLRSLNVEIKKHVVVTYEIKELQQEKSQPLVLQIY